MTERNDIHDDGNNSYGEKKELLKIKVNAQLKIE
jgi:hypothetical protein